MSVQLLIGIVSYRSGDTLMNCLDSLYNQDQGVDFEVSLVDNSPEGVDAFEARKRYPAIHVTPAPENPGYGGGMNRAFSATASHYFLILNPDTGIEPGALRKLVDYLEHHPDAGAVGPRLTYPNGSVHPSARREPAIDLALLECLDLNVRFPRNRRLAHSGYHGTDPADLSQIDWLTGAALVVRSDLFARLGGFDERFFMYFEETDLQRRIREDGARIGFCGDARFWHEQAHATRSTDARQVEFYKSLWYYFRKHHGWLQGVIIRKALVIRCLVLGTMIEIRYLFQRQTRAARLAPVRRLLAWCFWLAPGRTLKQTTFAPSHTDSP